MSGSEERLCWREDGDPAAGCGLRESRDNRPPGALSRAWGSGAEDQLRGHQHSETRDSQVGMTGSPGRRKLVMTRTDLQESGDGLGTSVPENEREGGEGALGAVEVEDKRWPTDTRGRQGPR